MRIYPDDCWIDSFDPALTETEVADAKAYWTPSGRPAASRIRSAAHGAVLAASHGSGRAAWIVQQFTAGQPAPPSRPRPSAQDVILTIPTETPLPAAEEAAALAFWRGSVARRRRCVRKPRRPRRHLRRRRRGARGGDRRDDYRRRISTNRSLRALHQDQVNVSVAFVIFPPVATKQTAWSRAPQVTILPDRFVFIGYDGAEATTIVARPTGALAAQCRPRSVGAQEEQLQHDADGNLVVPDELRWMADFDRAVEVGMGFRIDLNADAGSARLRSRAGGRPSAERRRASGQRPSSKRSSSITRSAARASRFCPQGTPTNNTEAASSGSDGSTIPTRASTISKAPLFAPERGLARQERRPVARRVPRASIPRCSPTCTARAQPTSSPRAR